MFTILYFWTLKKYYIYIIYILMDNNDLLMIVLAFVLGCMCSGMMKSMCGGRLIEGDELDGIQYTAISVKQIKDQFNLSNIDALQIYGNLDRDCRGITGNLEGNQLLYCKPNTN